MLYRLELYPLGYTRKKAAGEGAVFMVGGVMPLSLTYHVTT